MTQPAPVPLTSVHASSQIGAG